MILLYVSRRIKKMDKRYLKNNEKNVSRRAVDSFLINISPFQYSFKDMLFRRISPN